MLRQCGAKFGRATFSWMIGATGECSKVRNLMFVRRISLCVLFVGQAWADAVLVRADTSPALSMAGTAGAYKTLAPLTCPDRCLAWHISSDAAFLTPSSFSSESGCVDFILGATENNRESSQFNFAEMGRRTTNGPLPSPVPEPATLTLMGLGIASLLAARTLRKHFGGDRM